MWNATATDGNSGHLARVAIGSSALFSRTHTVGCQPRKEQAKGARGGNAKTICTELDFICCWYSRVLVIFTRVHPTPLTPTIKEESINLSYHVDFQRVNVVQRRGISEWGSGDRV